MFPATVRGIVIVAVEWFYMVFSCLHTNCTTFVYASLERSLRARDVDRNSTFCQPASVLMYIAISGPTECPISDNEADQTSIPNRFAGKFDILCVYMSYGQSRVGLCTKTCKTIRCTAKPITPVLYDHEYVCDKLKTR